MKLLVILLTTLSIFAAKAQTKMKMNFNNEELPKVIEAYSKASGQKFVVDPSVRGKATIIVQDSVSLEEAFDHLSSALALNGFAISKQGDTMVIKSARNIQRDLIEVSTALPLLKPERMVTWIYTAKNVPVVNINRELRIFPSKDGEMSVSSATNQIIISDWASNIHRINAILKEVDKKLDPSITKLVELSKKEAPMKPKLKVSKEVEKDQ